MILFPLNYNQQIINEFLNWISKKDKNLKIVDFFIRCSFHKLLFSLYYIPFPIMRYMMVKWKSNAISGFKVSFFRQNAKEFCSCQKISKANNWISFLGKYEIDDDKKGGFFFHILLDIGEDQCKKYLICILHCNRNQKMGSTY